MKKVRIGIFGLRRGLDNAKSIMLNDGEIVAVCDKRESRIQDARNLLGDVPAFTDFDEFIKQDMDAVYIANYFCEHVPFVIKAFERNIHVICECTAAATMAECVELVRAWEKSKSIYMLAENYPYMLFNQEMQRVYASGVLGRVMFAEGEYNHPGKGTSVETVKALYDSEKHWRCYLPKTYYITHSLGPIMMATGSKPIKVSAMPIRFETVAPPENDNVISNSYVNDRTCIIMTQNDDGSVYRVVGNSSFGAHGNTYRIAGTRGQIENLRGTNGQISLNFNDWHIPEGYEEHNLYYPKENELLGALAEKTGHDGGDFYMFRDFFDCINSGRNPFFDVYTSTLMSAVGILAHRSVLDGGKPYDVPDFRRDEDRVLWENDRLSPFYSYGTNEPTIQCASDPNYRPDEKRRERFLKIMEECKD